MSEPLLFETSPLFTVNYKSKKEIIVNQGGTRSGKTWSIIQVLLVKLLENPGTNALIVGQDIPNLKKGPIRLLHKIIRSSTILASQVVNWNISDRVLTLQNGSFLEMTSFSDAQDAKSWEGDWSYMNEANGMTFEIWTQINLRTRRQSFLDYNADCEFWIHDKLLKDPTLDLELFISDHRHNPFISDKQRAKIEALKNIDPDLWRVYARGLTGKIEGLIFRRWRAYVPGSMEEDEKGIPKGARFLGYGMDYGFTNDPTTLVAMWQLSEEDLIIQELLFETDLQTPDINRNLKELGVDRRAQIFADRSEARLNAELRRHGWNVIDSDSRPGSVNFGINTLKKYNLIILPGSANMERELRTYKWLTDKDGKPLNKPVPFADHTIDPLRYIAAEKLSRPTKTNGKRYTMA